MGKWECIENCKKVFSVAKFHTHTKTYKCLNFCYQKKHAQNFKIYLTQFQGQGQWVVKVSPCSIVYWPHHYFWGSEIKHGRCQGFSKGAKAGVSSTNMAIKELIKTWVLSEIFSLCILWKVGYALFTMWLCSYCMQLQPNHC